MTKERNSYKNIIKATSLFGGVKILQIIISIARSKFIAILLGPTGMGISGLITSSTSMVESLTGFGLRTSGVREVSQAFSSGKELEKNSVLTVLRKLIFFTGLLGTIITFLLSNQLSVWAFGNENYTFAFKIVSIILIFNQINIGYIVLLQGTFHYKHIAKSTLLGSILGLLLTIPLYYFFGVEGIVPAIILSSIIQLISTRHYSRKVPFKTVNLGLKEIFIKGKTMISLGIVIAFTGFASQGAAYLIKVFVSNYGSVTDVGLYTAGIAIASTYVGMVLNAMSTDYAPRLSAVSNNRLELIDVINKQVILLITILTPLIILFVVFIKQVIILLYSSKFIEITGMIEWVMLGMFFRAISWSISFSFVGRGDSKAFFWNEIITTLYYFILSAIGYYLIGLTGLGIAFVTTYVIYSLHMLLLAKKKFQFSFSIEFLKLFIPQILLTSFCFVLVKSLEYNIYRYLIGTLFFLITGFISLKKINQMIDIKSFLKRNSKF